MSSHSNAREGYGAIFPVRFAKNRDCLAETFFFWGGAGFVPDEGQTRKEVPVTFVRQRVLPAFPGGKYG